MKYVLLFVLLTCALSASIKARMETAAERVQTTNEDDDLVEARCLSAGVGYTYMCGSVCYCFNGQGRPVAIN